MCGNIIILYHTIITACYDNNLSFYQIDIAYFCSQRIHDQVFFYIYIRWVKTYQILQKQLWNWKNDAKKGNLPQKCLHSTKEQKRRKSISCHVRDTSDNLYFVIVPLQIKLYWMLLYQKLRNNKQKLMSAYNI